MFSSSNSHHRGRGLGRSVIREGRNARLVERLVIHGDPIEFREVCQRAIPPSTQFLVLDLDRTFHLNRNMGELLGWDLVAYHAYGAEYLEGLQGRRGPGRFLLDPSRPGDLLRYLRIGVRMWAGPGLYYLLWGKIAARLESLRRWSFLRYGPEPVRTVQRVPQTALMHQLAEVPLETLRELARGVWDRHAEDLVIDREDIQWLRERCPGIRIIVSSASPRPVLEVAAERLGVDHVAYSAQEEHEGWLSAPFWLSQIFLHRGDPRRLSAPSHMRYNVSYGKIEHLLERFPELGRPDAQVVGITDNGYGEDQCWAQYFSRVIDINSPSPFTPVVAVDSPLQEIHSVQVLTRKEKDRRTRGEASWTDPRRKKGPGFRRDFGRGELEGLLAGGLEEIEGLANRYRREVERLSDQVSHLMARLDAVTGALEDAVLAYNDAPGVDRPEALDRVQGVLKQQGVLQHHIHQVEKPLSEVAFQLTRLLEKSRSVLEGPGVRT